MGETPYAVEVDLLHREITRSEAARQVKRDGLAPTINGARGSATGKGGRAGGTGETRRK